MAINKVVDRNNNTLLDLTLDTVTPNKVLAGETFHDKYGNTCTGTLTSPSIGEIDISKYNFIDYDGTLLYSYTDEELDALTSLPAGPDHTGENLTFQEWNWSLEDLKAWNRERPDRPIIGAHYITTDRKTYLYLNTPLNGGIVSITANNASSWISIDWGDGTVDTSFSSTKAEHTYSNKGNYVIVIDIAEGGYWYFGSSSTSKTTNKQYIDHIKVGNISMFYMNFCANLYNLKSITVPSNISSFYSKSFYNCSKLKSIVVPNGIETINGFYACYLLKTISISNSVTSIGSECFRDNYDLSDIVLSDSISSIDSNAFYGCRSLRSIYIPGSVSSISSYAFYYCHSLQNLIIGHGVTNISSSCFTSCYSLKYVEIPSTVQTISSSFGQSGLETVKINDGLKTIGSTAFNGCAKLKKINIPDSVTSIGSDCFSVSLELDLSEQTKVIPLTGSIGFSNTQGGIILVPSNLLDQYKSASYWSSYADCMVGV